MGLHRTLILAGVLAALLAPWRPAKLTAQEGPVRLDVVGVDAELRRNVMATLSLAASGRGAVPEARVRRLHGLAPGEVTLALEAFGHYEPRVESDLRFEGGRWIATYTVDPGPPVRIAGVDVRVEGEGRADPEFGRALERSPLSVGDPLLHARYAATKVALESVAAERGYLDAAFDSSLIRVDRRARTAEIVLHFRTGPRFEFGSVTFQQDVLDPEILEALVSFGPGTPFDATALLTLQNELTEGPYFSSAEIVPRRDLAEGFVVPIEVHLVPHRPQRYLVGLGYGTDTGPRATANAEIRRLNRGGHRMEAEVRTSLIERRVFARYLVPLTGAHDRLLTLSSGFVDASPTTSDTETFLLGAQLSGLVGGWRNDLSLTLQRAAFEVGLDSGVSTLLVFGAGLSRVRADDRIFPTRGSLMGLRVRAAPDAWMSETRFLQVGLEGRLIQSLGSRTRVLVRAEAGAVLTSDFRSLPASSRYFAGGDRGLRGFGFQSLGPKDTAGNVVGGDRLLVGSLELDRRIWERWGAAVFFDAGNALTSFSDPLEAGTGVGVRWRSPIGLIRIDMAFAVSRDSHPFRIHLNIGPEL